MVSPAASEPADLYNCTFANNAGSADISWSSNDSTLRLWGCTYGTVGMASANAQARLLSTRDQGTASAHKLHAPGFSAQTETSVRHTASGVSWKVSPTSSSIVNSLAPAAISLARVACNASALVTVKVWVRRTNTGLSAGLRVFANSLPGVGTSDLTTLMTAAADTWEQVTLTVTPQSEGLLTLYGYAWGGTTYSAFFDDLTVTP